MSTPADKFEADRQEKLRKIEAMGIDPWGSRFDDAQPIAQIRELEPTADAATGPQVRAMGRIFSMRKMGKVRFIDLADRSGRIQVMAGQKQIGDQAWNLAECFDLGDLLAVEGRFGLTKTGERTIFADRFQYQGTDLA